MHVFGLTGGIASGKTYVARLFASKGVPVIDADQVSREVVEPGTDGLRALVEALGEQVLLPDGTLNRKRVADIMFDDPAKLKIVNGIVHPRVAVATQAHFARLDAAGEQLVCYDATLIIENGYAEAFRPLVVVTAPDETRVARAMQRDGATEQHVRARIAAQMPQKEKVAKADIVIENDADLATLETRALDALERVRRWSSKG